MIKYINTKTGQYPVSTRTVERYAKRADRPDYVDPVMGKLEPVTEVPMPQVDYKHKVREGKPELKGNAWVQTWVVEEVPANIATAILESTTNSVREKRNFLLKNSDWTQLLDTPVDKNAWAKYRSDLRSLPEQQGFPFSVIWPPTP